MPPPRVIILALADDYGFNNVGYPHGPSGGAGNPEMRTPTLDQLAMEGVRLERHYVYKVCSPTRSALLSSCTKISRTCAACTEGVTAIYAPACRVTWRAGAVRTTGAREAERRGATAYRSHGAGIAGV